MIESKTNEIIGKQQAINSKVINLILDNVFLEVRFASNDIEFKLWDTLSFTIQDYNPNVAPVTRHLFNRKTKKTYAGLLPHVQEILDQTNEKYIIIDNRIKWEQNAEFGLVKYLDKNRTIELKTRDYQQEVIDTCRPREIIQAATSSGKKICLSTLILTPGGWKQMRDIHSGDIIFDEDGIETKVLYESPVELTDVYEINFQDRTSIKCCKDHLWKTFEYTTGFNIEKPKVLSITQMLQQKFKGFKNSYKLAIPINKPIQFSKKELLIHPYVLGLLLGSGNWTNNAITFSNSEIDITNKLKILTKQYGTWSQFANTIQYIFKNLPDQKIETNQFINWIYNTFKRSESNKKFIPKEYLYSSIEDRLELARGLIDVNGTIDSNGHINFYTVSEQLKDDFIFLIRSLGYRIRLINTKKSNLAYNIYIYGCDDLLFSSNKHKQKFANRKIHKQHRYDILKIKSIKKLNYQEKMKCIAVDSPKHTYICENFIVTHNTFIMAGLIAKFNVKPVSIFADKISLCTQLQKEFSKFLGEPVGLVGGGIKDIRDITVYSVQSATEEMVKDTKLLMVDECHHQACDTFGTVSRWCKDAYYRIGVSATPWRSDGADLLIDACFTKQDPSKKITASFLIERGYLTPCTIYWVRQPQIVKGKNYNTLYRDAIVMNVARNKNIVNIVTQLRRHKNATILILIQRIEHGRILLNMLKDYLSNKSFFMEVINKNGKKTLIRINEIDMISGEDAPLRREAVLQAFREKKCKIVLASTIMDEGISVDSIDTIILAGAGKSSTRAYQRIGRGLRLHPDKKKCTIIDFWDRTDIFFRQSRARNKMYKAEPSWEIKEFPSELLEHMPEKLKK